MLADFNGGLQALKSGEAGEALPYLARALRKDPGFWQAGMRVLSTLTQKSFATEEVKILHQEKPIATSGFNAESMLAWSLEKDGPLGWVWDVATGKPLYPLAEGKRPNNPEFSRDGTRLFAVVENQLRGWEARTGTDLGYRIDVASTQHKRVETADGAGFFGVLDRAGALAVYRSDTGQAVSLEAVNAPGRLGTLEFTPDGSKVCALDSLGALIIWSTADGRLVSRIDTGSLQGSTLWMSPDSAFVLMGDSAKQRFQWWSTDESPDGNGAETEAISTPALVSEVRWADDSRLLVLVSSPGTGQHEIASYDLRTREAIPRIVRENVTMTPIFAGDRFAMVGFVIGGTTMEMWDLRTGKEMPEKIATAEAMSSPTFSLDGRRIIAGFGSPRNEDAFRIWDAFTGKHLSERVELGGDLGLARESPDSQRWFTVDGSNHGMLHLWDSRSGRALAQPFTATGGKAPDFRLRDFFRDGLHGIARNHHEWIDGDLSKGDLEVLNFDSSTAVLPEALRALVGEGDVRHVEFSRDGKRVLAVGLENANVAATRMYFCDVWDTETREVLFRYRQRGILHSAAFDDVGKRVVITHLSQARASIWDIATGSQVMSLPQEGSGSNITGYQREAKFSPDGKSLLTWWGFDSANTLHLWDLETGRDVFPPIRLNENTYDYRQVGNRIHLATARRYLEIDADTGETLRERPTGANWNWRSALSPDLRHLAFVPDPKTVSESEAYVMAIDTGERVSSMPHEDTVRSLQFSPDGAILATSTGTNATVPMGKAYLWDWRTGSPLVPPMDMRGFVPTIAFSPDGALLAAVTTVTITDHSKLFLWDVATGRQVMEPVPLGVVGAQAGGNDRAELAFSPDGRQVLVGADKGTIQLIDLPPRHVPVPDWLPWVAEAIAGSSLTDSLGINPVGADELQSLRKEILALPSTDRYTKWAQWILADRASRTVAPGDPRTRAEYLHQLLYRGDEEALHEALLLAPDHALAHARMGYVLATSPELDKETDPPHRAHWMDTAQWYLDRALKLDDANAEVWACQAEVHLRRGDAEAARKAAERAIELDPESANANYLLATTLAEAGDWDRAEEAFQKALAPLT